MIFSTRPDFDRVETAWDHFYAGEVAQRPLVLATAHVGPGKPVALGEQRYQRACAGNYQEQLDLIDRHLEQTLYLGESVPMFSIDHGPDQFAAFLGAELKFSDDSPGTNWVDPIVDDWEQFLPIRLDESNPTFQSVLQFARLMAEHGEGRYLVSPIDSHSHADTLSAIRGPQQFVTDFMDHPEQLERAMIDARALYPLIYNAIYDAGNMGGDKGCGQLIWSRGKCGIIQCDCIIMLGPEHFRRYILPAIEEETEFLDHCIFHLDGVGAFRHLDDLLALPGLDMIQLVPGAGQKPAHEWVDILKHCVAAGKGVQVYGAGLDFDRIKLLHRELGPRGVLYCPSTRDADEINRIIDWLEANT